MPNAYNTSVYYYQERNCFAACLCNMWGVNISPSVDGVDSAWLEAAVVCRSDDVVPGGGLGA